MIFGKIVVNGLCSGRRDDPTVIAIRSAQEELNKTRGAGTTIDGRVSPARGYSFGATLFTIVHFNNIFKEKVKSIWPRLDLMPECPARLGAAVLEAVIGT